MSKRDSHPEHNQSPTLTGMGARTEPGAPPDATPPYVRPARRSSPSVDPAADLAASLLKDLARTSLPAEGVPETSGQNAAAYAVSARRPPKAQEDKTLEPAVVVNMTEPFPIALQLPSPLPPRRDDATLVMEPRRVLTDPNDPRARKTMPAMRMAQAVPPPSSTASASMAPPTPLPLMPRPMQKTVLGPRQQRRQVLLGIMSVIGIATLVAIGILAFAPRARTAASSAATSELTAATTEAVTVTTAAPPPVPVSASAAVESPAVLVSAPLPPVTAAAPPPPAPPSPPTPRATARVAPSGRSAPTSKPTTPKPANTFEEPDRTF